MESWLTEVPYMNITAWTVYQEKAGQERAGCRPFRTWNSTALKDHQEELGPRAKWPKYIPLMDLNARAKRHERRWPRAKWLKSVGQLDFPHETLPMRSTSHARNALKECRI
ncbi:hypothetical protein AA0118_g4874 [Alternaria tenuissima]|nr:hypothetical protein AALT_g4509 [Alternaria alternata]RYN63128.1 hypothetical protein AA0118_g4874 [Alternaria tenuissima]RYN96385.1 hypothetical protein AA0120_g2936 [Alternaria tenuissima]RYO52639.1 hypothetical protein AA0116_g11559 [Alternaria tenuissima]